MTLDHPPDGETQPTGHPGLEGRRAKGLRYARTRGFEPVACSEQTHAARSMKAGCQLQRLLDGGGTGIRLRSRIPLSPITHRRRCSRRHRTLFHERRLRAAIVTNRRQAAVIRHREGPTRSRDGRTRTRTDTAIARMVVRGGPPSPQ